jgi:predicted P-loop ATPase
MKNIELIETYLNNKSVFRYNTVSMRTEYRQINEENYYPLDERKLKSLFRELNKNNLTVAKNNLECLLSSDYAEIYNPFTDYFDKLPAVEGTKNIDLFCLTLKTHDDQLFKWAFTKWIVAMVGNMIDENVINHQCIVLSGSQGIGKSTWVRNLLPNKLKPYYHEGNIKLGDKDSLKNISTKCLINLDELAGMTSKQSPMLKELITKSNTELRKAYAHLDEFFVRRASFIGSINGGEFLYDLTGNRRFLCFEVDWFENTGNHNMNMDLIFAEAYHLFKNGFQYWFNHEDQIKVEENNKQFISIPPEEEELLRVFSPVPFTEEYRDDYLNRLFMDEWQHRCSRHQQKRNHLQIEPLHDFAVAMTASEVYQVLYGNKPDHKVVSKFGRILAKHKFERIKNKGVYKYKLYERKPKAKFVR